MSLYVQNSIQQIKSKRLWTQSGFSSLDISPSASSTRSSIFGTQTPKSAASSNTRSSIASYGFLGGTPSKDSTIRMDFADYSASSGIDLEEDGDTMGKILIENDVDPTEDDGIEGIRRIELNKKHFPEAETEKMPEEDEEQKTESTASPDVDDMDGTDLDQSPEILDEAAADTRTVETKDEDLQGITIAQPEANLRSAPGDAMTSEEPDHSEGVYSEGAEAENMKRNVVFREPSNASSSDLQHVQLRRSFSDGVIDNTTLEYVEMKLNCGVRVMCAPQVLASSPLVLRSLQTDVQRLFTILPRSLHGLLRRTNIWVNKSYSYGSFDDPQVLRHSTAHHSEGWLVDCARDIPEKACSIEIYDCKNYERMRLHWNGAGLLLHEFCHLVHQFCLGLDNAKVEELYQTADCSGKYNQTPRRDWAGCDQTHDMAYALVDQKEFFAEMSVAYLSNGYRHLTNGDSTMLETCSPPLLLPNVFQRVLKQHGIEDPLERPEDSACYLFDYAKRRHPKPKLDIADPIFRERAIATNCRNIDICNKFYPFTRGQLRHHDPALCDAMRGLWKEIARWKDPDAESDSKCSFPGF